MAWSAAAGVIANSFSYDHAGPLTWTVEDAAIALQILAGYDPRDPASAKVDIPDYRAALSSDIRGLRVGVARHFHEDNPNADPELVAAFEAALEVLRGLGAIIEDLASPMRTPHEYQHIKVVTAESELLSVHEGNLRSRPGDFGDDFLGRVLPACLLTARDYLNSQRERRTAIAEMEPIYAAHDVIASIGPGPAPELGAWRTIQFWQNGSITAPFNVTGGPALVQCIGYTASGLPLSMQLAGRPFNETTVLRAGHAYERATPWRERRPVLDPSAAFSTALPPVPEPPAIDCTQGGARHGGPGRPARRATPRCATVRHGVCSRPLRGCNPPRVGSRTRLVRDTGQRVRVDTDLMRAQWTDRKRCFRISMNPVVT